MMCQSSFCRTPEPNLVAAAPLLPNVTPAWVTQVAGPRAGIGYPEASTPGPPPGPLAGHPSGGEPLMMNVRQAGQAQRAQNRRVHAMQAKPVAGCGWKWLC